MSSSSHQQNAVPIDQLGLAEEDALALHQAQAHINRGGGAGSSSSRAASRASSQGLLMMDTSSLRQLGHHFDRVVRGIQERIQHLTEQCDAATRAMYDEAGNLVADADAEIARYHRIMAELDDLDLEFDRIENIREIVRGYRQRAADLERELAMSTGSSTSRRHHQSSSSSRHHHHGHKHGHSSSRSRH
ncbi:hypothetical protein MCOR25_003536 [Pyricularia grisea]|uniref:Biogenesis of lysosome-related organelles complex 1 subunit CNL1 n=1 Tax=Pyricularia grisea TaxID=148305 RepID=A0A6P8AYU2_PYRGI|nr:hypothetical protein PgNI_10334 [Pyricularia grisea]KAI6373138.1 hypothetical protein MCOR25_003536 [Pyricularia grisea]TLD07464.1 hypothetical protein PgNI_10334 [Pyricularia grisea]